MVRLERSARWVRKARWVRGVTQAPEAPPGQQAGPVTPAGREAQASQVQSGSGGLSGRWECRGRAVPRAMQATPGRREPQACRVSAYRVRRVPQGPRAGFLPQSTAPMSRDSVFPTIIGQRTRFTDSATFRARAITTSRPPPMWAVICAAVALDRTCSVASPAAFCKYVHVFIIKASLEATCEVLVFRLKCRRCVLIVSHDCRQLTKRQAPQRYKHTDTRIGGRQVHAKTDDRSVSAGVCSQRNSGTYRYSRCCGDASLAPPRPRCILAASTA